MSTSDSEWRGGKGIVRLLRLVESDTERQNLCSVLVNVIPNQVSNEISDGEARIFEAMMKRTDPEAKFLDLKHVKLAVGNAILLEVRQPTYRGGKTVFYHEFAYLFPQGARAFEVIIASPEGVPDFVGFQRNVISSFKINSLPE